MDEPKSARKEKICQEEDCREEWEQLPQAVREHTMNFVYCPFCASELVVRCSACGEIVTDANFTYCPWCGAKFEQ